MLQPNGQERKVDDWWITWQYSDDKINFNNFNEGNTAKLANQTYRSEWIIGVTEDIASSLTNINFNESL